MVTPAKELMFSSTFVSRMKHTQQIFHKLWQKMAHSPLKELLNFDGNLNHIMLELEIG